MQTYQERYEGQARYEYPATLQLFVKGAKSWHKSAKIRILHSLLCREFFFTKNSFKYQNERRSVNLHLVYNNV